MPRNQGLPEAGQVVGGKYQVKRMLGAGGMGVVFEGINVATDKRVALKFLSPDLSYEADAVERFGREARATGRIHHPNVVTMHDYGEHNGMLYLVMELLAGFPLHEWLHERRLSAEEACRIMLPVMRGVAAAHAEGVLHRDLKPENIFLAESPDGLDPVPKVLDFGIAKLNEAQGAKSALSATGRVMGTYQYMAPEQLRGQSDLDERVDVYALGAILYAMLTARLPYVADNPVDMALQILESEPPLMSSLVPEVPSALSQSVARALARDRSARYASVAEFALALEAFAGGLRFRGASRVSGAPSYPSVASTGIDDSKLIGVPSRGTSFSPRPPVTKRSRRLPVGIGAGLVAVVVALTALAAWQLSDRVGPATPSPPVVSRQTPEEVAVPTPTQARAAGRESAPSGISPPPALPQAPRPLEARPFEDGAHAGEWQHEGLTFEEPPAAEPVLQPTELEDWPSPAPPTRVTRRSRGRSSSRRDQPEDSRVSGGRHSRETKGASAKESAQHASSPANEQRPPTGLVSGSIEETVPEEVESAPPRKRSPRTGLLLDADEF